jgi:hypothetical protein
MIKNIEFASKGMGPTIVGEVIKDSQIIVKPRNTSRRCPNITMY